MRLAKLLKKSPDGAEYVEHLEGDGPTIFKHVCKLGGIVSKPTDMKYQHGPSKAWLKVKNKKHPVVLRVKEGFKLERQRHLAGSK